MAVGEERNNLTKKGGGETRPLDFHGEKMAVHPYNIHLNDERNEILVNHCNAFNPPQDPGDFLQNFIDTTLDEWEEGRLAVEGQQVGDRYDDPDVTDQTRAQIKTLLNM
jgi:hypothetical protein